MINRQDRQKITFHGSAYPKEISQQCTPATHTEAVQCQRVLFGLPSLSLTTKGYWIHLLGEGCQVSRQLSDASTPLTRCIDYLMS